MNYSIHIYEHMYTQTGTGTCEQMHHFLMNALSTILLVRLRTDFWPPRTSARND